MSWFEFSFVMSDDAPIEDIMEFIYNNVKTEFLSYHEKYFYEDASLEDGPLPIIEFKGYAVDSIDVHELVSEKFPHAIMTGSMKPFEWTAGGSVTQEEKEWAEKLHKEYGIR